MYRLYIREYIGAKDVATEILPFYNPYIIFSTPDLLIYLAMKRIILLAAILLIFNQAFSQTAPPADLVTIQQGLDKLNILGSVLYVAAHPDDENTRLLAYLAQEKH